MPTKIVPKNLTIINLLPHSVDIYTEHRAEPSIPPSGKVARIEAGPIKVVGHVNVSGTPVPLISEQPGEIVGLPGPHPDTLYIVSLPVLMSLGGSRDDVCCPNTGPNSGCLRNASGQVMMVRSLRF